MSSPLRWGSPAGLVRSGRALHEFGFMPPRCYRSRDLVHRLDNAQTVACITRESGGIWRPLNHSQLASPTRTYSERGNVMADVAPTAVHAFATGPRGRLSRRSQLISFDSALFTPSGEAGNDSGFPVSWEPVRPEHISRPITQTTMWLAVHLLTAYNFGGLTTDERDLVDRGYASPATSAGEASAATAAASVEL